MQPDPAITSLLHAQRPWRGAADVHRLYHKPRRMNARMLNETRLILWPWCLTTLSGLAPLTKLILADKRTDWPDAVAVFGFFGGAGVLTALSFRNAQRSCSAELLSDEGNKIWAEKMATIALAVLCAGSIACLAQLALGTIAWKDLSVQEAFEPVLLLVIIVCSAGFWTLLARSVVGGLLLTAVAQFVLYLLLVLFATLVNRMAPVKPGETNLVHTPEVHAALSWFVGGFGLSYAAVMLWVGRRRLATMGLK
jgi:hypothetical protein